MAHGTPIGIADNDERYGEGGAFLIDAGISSSYHIAKFFGLTERVRVPGEVVKEVARPAPTMASKEAAKPIPLPVRSGKPSRAPRRSGVDVSSVITRALTAAGLMK